MTELEALIGLNLTRDIAGIRLKKLLEVFGRPENILNASFESLRRVYGIGDVIAEKIKSIRQEDIERELCLAKKSGVKIIIASDPEYPENLKNIYDPPIVIYLKGEISRQNQQAIAIVGSRRASFYGLSAAQNFADELAQEGFTIISGLARGIDSSAHRGALKAKGKTIAVIGSGFNCLYPSENTALAQQIAENGAVISEFPMDTPPMRQNFPRRNRLISGLSNGVLVIEAARNSGALITADFALEQGKDVFALPGKVDALNSFGTNELIKQGAKLVTCIEDILEEFYGVSFHTINRIYPQNPAAEFSDEKEEELYGLISGQAIQFEELAQKCGFDIPEICAILFRLQLKKAVKELPGKYFLRNPRPS